MAAYVLGEAQKEYLDEKKYGKKRNLKKAGGPAMPHPSQDAWSIMNNENFRADKHKA